MHHSYAVSSDLTGEALTAAARVWDELEVRFGLTKTRAALRPHVTYVVATHDDPELLGEAARSAASRVGGAFEVELDGVGVFEGERPVVYYRVVKAGALLEAYGLFHRAVLGTGAGLWPHYTPEIWVPHVTLALQDLERDRLPEVLAFLETRPSRFTSRLEAADLVRVVHPFHEYLGRFPFGGKEKGQAPLPAIDSQGA